ncbi:RrF2 family transcriptional regulator [Anaerostipes sp.]|uniref:RrF2 family transcriptional regulator n=1 Tax=Anaerostipes sp. TaxID=1872530 RepID=UPI0025BCAF0C|nr:Rrf2 family transcriptional regulator [Anaerostipes sp.]MBS7007506.1 Rrf2 family transcriptional regulator [Anaerostipes sp.]
MLISRETDYALRILRALSDGEKRSIEEICSLEATPKQFAYRIIKKLEKSGWIVITRGAEGGCRLTADLHDVSLHDLIHGLGSSFCINACFQEGYECTRSPLCEDPCHIKEGLAKLQESMEKELKDLNLHCLIFGSPN